MSASIRGDFSVFAFSLGAYALLYATKHGAAFKVFHKALSVLSFGTFVARLRRSCISLSACRVLRTQVGSLEMSAASSFSLGESFYPTRNKKSLCFKSQDRLNPKISPYVLPSPKTQHMRGLWNRAEVLA
jgi:hypothetical protein